MPRRLWAEAQATLRGASIGAGFSGWSTRPECGLRRPAEDAGARVAPGWAGELTAARPRSLRRVAAKGTRVECSTRSSRRRAFFGPRGDGGAARKVAWASAQRTGLWAEAQATFARHRRPRKKSLTQIITAGEITAHPKCCEKLPEHHARICTRTPRGAAERIFLP